MSVEIKQKTVDVIFETSAGGKLTGAVVDDDRKHRPDDKALRLHFSLMGETSPAFTPLPSDYTYDGATSVFRYDWMVGATPIAPAYQWNWFERIAEKRAFVVQILIDPGESACGFSEHNALLLALQPSQDTSSWVDRNSEKLGESLAKLSEVTGQFSRLASNIMKTSAVMSNFVTSDEKGQKNWFIYRFLDQKRRCAAVEWNIHRNVLHQYGPLLRGSIVLAFHGGEKPKKPMTLLLRPRINFGESNSMDYSPPEEQLEANNPVALSITPVPVVGG